MKKILAWLTAAFTLASIILVLYLRFIEHMPQSYFDSLFIIIGVIYAFIAAVASICNIKNKSWGGKNEA